MFKISVITPSFNSGNYIERAIKSVLEQDYKNLEHIIVDGGSTDGTVDILRKYKHLIWKSEPDNGQADAMNKGFERSSGDVIVYLNADDYFFSGAFSRVINEFKKGTKFVVGNVLVKSSRLKTKFLNIPKISLEKMLRHWEPNAFCHNSSGYFYLREVQLACPFNKDNYATMDLEFLLDAAKKYSFTKINYTLGCFEDSKKNKTGVTQSRLDYWQPDTFPYLEKHLSVLSKKERIVYENDRRNGYAAMQAHMNRLNKNSFKNIPAENLPLISVVIPTYNCGVHLCRSMNSVLAQKLEKFEIIVVDDASTDNTQEILEKNYKGNPFVRVITHDKNRMLGASRNTGLDNAKGKYVLLLDSDDWLAEGTLLHLASIAEKYKAEIVACGAKKVWDNGKRETYHAHAFASKGGIEALYHFADHRIGSIAWNKLYLRELIENQKLRFIFPYWYEDVMFTIQLIYACSKYISITDTHYNYFQRDGSYNHSKPTMLNLKSNINVYLQMIKFAKRIDLCRNEERRGLYRRLLKSHCSDDVFPKMINYARTRSQDEWESQCQSACCDLLGIEEGYAVSDFLIRAMNELKKADSAGKISININSIKKMLNKCKVFIIHGKLRQPLRKIYYATGLNNIVINFKKRKDAENRIHGHRIAENVTKREDINYELTVLKNNFYNLSTAYEYLFGKYFNNISKKEKRNQMMQRLLGSPPSESYFIVSSLEKTKELDGDVCEFGVAQGETSALIANEIMLTKKKLHLFDSFEGLPKPTKKDMLKDDIFKLGTMEAYAGTMNCPEQMVIDRLGALNFPKDRYSIHKGFIEKLIIEKHNFPEKVSFSYLDFDFYEPTKITLEFLDGITEKGAIIMVDDYDFFSTGIKFAVDEFIADKNKIDKKYELFIPDKIFGCFAIITKL
jgi:O-methyltransferase